MLERQNLKENIQLLKAMRYCYNIAKLFFNIRISGSIGISFVAIIFGLLTRYKIIAIDLSSFFTLLGSIWLLVYFILGLYESRYIECGAKIQEEFDTNVFQLSWNEALIGERINPEDIVEYASKFKGDESSLMNWYGGLDSKRHYVNVLLSQRSNLMWALSLKRNYLLLILLLTVTYLVLTIIVGLLIDVSLRDYMLVVFIPSVSIFVYCADTTSRLYNQIKVNNRLGEEIRVTCEKNWEIVNAELSRKYQDAVYIYNRLNAVLIPEKLYWLRRDSDDTKMIEINKMISNKI